MFALVAVEDGFILELDTLFIMSMSGNTCVINKFYSHWPKEVAMSDGAKQQQRSLIKMVISV